MTDQAPPEISERVQRALLEVVSYIPPSSYQASQDPGAMVARIERSAKARAAGIAGALAIPPGPIGFLTIMPELYLIWKIQAQMVADIAAVYGKSAALRQETMLLCLFKHGAASLARDLLINVGQRVLVRRASLRFVQAVLARLGIRITQRAIGSGISRWIPIIGSGFVAAYAWYDTAKVAESAIELFSRDLELSHDSVDIPT
jgi:hypothetical protein